MSGRVALEHHRKHLAHAFEVVRLEQRRRVLEALLDARVPVSGGEREWNRTVPQRGRDREAVVPAEIHIEDRAVELDAADQGQRLRRGTDRPDGLVLQSAEPTLDHHGDKWLVTDHQDPGHPRLHLGPRRIAVYHDAHHHENHTMGKGPVPPRASARLSRVIAFAERVMIAHGGWHARDGAVELHRAFRWLLDHVPFLRNRKRALDSLFGAYSCRRTGVHPGSSPGRLSPECALFGRREPRSMSLEACARRTPRP